MIEIIQTDKKSRRYWRKLKNSEFAFKKRIKYAIVEIFSSQKKQQIIGFGGAFTESACYNIMNANPQSIETIMRAYFTKDGLNYSLGRVVINSCDFSLDSYSYVSDGDENLSSFNIGREKNMLFR